MIFPFVMNPDGTRPKKSATRGSLQQFAAHVRYQIVDLILGHHDAQHHGETEDPEGDERGSEESGSSGGGGLSSSSRSSSRSQSPESMTTTVADPNETWSWTDITNSSRQSTSGSSTPPSSLTAAATVVVERSELLVRGRHSGSWWNNTALIRRVIQHCFAEHGSNRRSKQALPPHVHLIPAQEGDAGDDPPLMLVVGDNRGC